MSPGESGVYKEHARFQLEATKLGRTLVFQVTVFEKRDRRGVRLFAETQCSDPYNFLIQFIIRDASSFEDVLQRFIEQLRWRGYTPLQYRVRQRVGQQGYQRWGQWVPIPEVA